VEGLRTTWGVPGAAGAIVEDGRTTMGRGFGITDISAPRAVDADTNFFTGSTGKAFTAAALAVLVDQGRIGWDDRVIDHMPDFRMYDSWVTREMTIRDLLVHRSGLGLGAGDLLFVPTSSRTRAETSARVGVAQANVARTRASIQRAESAVAFSRDQAERARKLHAASGTSKQALEQAEYNERSAQEELANAQLGARVAESELVAARAALASITGAVGTQPATKLSLTAPVAGPFRDRTSATESADARTGIARVTTGAGIDDCTEARTVGAASKSSAVVSVGPRVLEAVSSAALPLALVASGAA
jgi:hypothetical protein